MRRMGVCWIGGVHAHPSERRWRCPQHSNHLQKVSQLTDTPPTPQYRISAKFPQKIYYVCLFYLPWGLFFTFCRRSCAQSFPTTTAHGLLWAWLEPDSCSGPSEAAATPLPTIPAADPSGVPWFEVASWYVREMPVDYVALMENSADPSHVHFTHAGESPNRHSQKCCIWHIYSC